MYKLTESPTHILRLDDNAVIPEGHRWWDEYQAWLAEGNTPEPVDIPDYKALIADRRWNEMGAGTTLNGTLLATDDAAQTRINGAAISAMLDPNYTLDWKGADGVWVSLNAQQIIGIAVTIRNHVQACYNREKALADMVDAGTFELSMLDEGWPNQQETP